LDWKHYAWQRANWNTLAHTIYARWFPGHRYFDALFGGVDHPEFPRASRESAHTLTIDAGGPVRWGENFNNKGRRVYRIFVGPHALPILGWKIRHIRAPKLQVRSRPIWKFLRGTPGTSRGGRQPFRKHALNIDVNRSGRGHLDNFSIVKFVAVDAIFAGQSEKIVPSCESRTAECTHPERSFYYLMKRRRVCHAILCRMTAVRVAAATLGLATVSAAGQPLAYPPAHKSQQVDNYHGVQVADPYRWLEDDRSPETASWVKAENQLTAAYLAKIPYRHQVRARLDLLYNFAKYTPPFHRGVYLFYRKNSGLQNQSVLYVQKGLSGTPRVLLDPNKLSADGTSQLATYSVSKDGKYLGYTVSRGGSDWQEGQVIEIATGKMLADRLSWLKFTDLSWAGDGFFYTRFPAPKAGRELSSKNEAQTVYFHRVGTSQREDQLVYEDKQHPARLFDIATTDDERFAILTVEDASLGKTGNALFYRDLTKNDKKFRAIVPDVTEDQYAVVDNLDDKFLILTNWKAPNKRLLLCNPARPASQWKIVIAEKPNAIESMTQAGGKLFANYLEDVATHEYVYGLDGKLENEIKLPGPGSATGFGGERNDTAVFYSFSSPNIPPTIYRYEIATRRSSVFRAPTIPDFDPARFETKQIFYKSKDGTPIPMFLTYRKGLAPNGSNPTLLYAYGGFDLITAPAFSALRLALLEQGFVYASANIRGGGEYGEKWHRAGTKLRKQNVFDDFIAAAEWLIARKYTSSQKLAILGASNGGLLMGAVINQRPELFRAAIVQAGVLDMLRFQKFTIGADWIADYGSSANPKEFKALYAYSPLHNIRAGVKYPATLITTADHDDRVVPGHSFKYAAALQAAASHANPVLIRIDTNSGHGPSSTTKILEQTQDIYSFLFYNLDVTPHF
jgi:prolyl oligopeptidase